MNSLKLALLMLSIGTLGHWVTVPGHPLVAILIKSTLIAIMYFFILYRYRLSVDVVLLMDKFLKRD